MPKGFDQCVAAKGRVRTITHGNSYIHICYTGGKSYAGTPHTKQTSMPVKKKK